MSYVMSYVVTAPGAAVRHPGAAGTRSHYRLTETVGLVSDSLESRGNGTVKRRTPKAVDMAQCVELHSKLRTGARVDALAVDHIGFNIRSVDTTAKGPGADGR